jgi:signal transduction histidine kinase
MIPLRVRGNTRFGHVILSHSEVHEWRDEELHRFQITAQHLASTLDSRLQHERLASQGQQMAIFEERQRIARDLHDSVTQLLFSMTLIAQTTANAYQKDPAEGERRMGRLIELSQTALAEMRALLAELRPPAPQPTGRELLETAGLVAAIEAHLRAIREGDAVLELDARGYRRTTFTNEHALYRIVQEAVANARKHARATQIRVRLTTRRTGEIRLQVRDDGVGFTLSPPTDRTPGSGMGLSTMAERAQKVGGVFRIRSQPRLGTTIEVILPAPPNKDV